MKKTDKPIRNFFTCKKQNFLFQNSANRDKNWILANIYCFKLTFLKPLHFRYFFGQKTFFWLQHLFFTFSIFSIEIRILTNSDETGHSFIWVSYNCPETQITALVSLKLVTKKVPFLHKIGYKHSFIRMLKGCFNFHQLESVVPKFIL